MVKNIDQKDTLDGICILASCDRGEVCIVSGDTSWVMTIDEFRENAVECPDGEARRLQLIQKSFQEDVASIQNIESSSDPMLLLSGSSEPAVQDQPASDDRSVKNVFITEQQCETMKDKLVKVREKASSLSKMVSRSSVVLKSIMNEKAVLVRAQAEAMGHKLKIANGFIESIYGYLGSGIDITDITDGPTGEGPIVIRQLIAYMDEEMYIAESEKLLLKPKDIQPFIGWLRKNIRTLIPESRGILGMRITRQQNSHYSSRFDEADEHEFLHLIVKNGERITMFHTGISIHQTLIPTRDELDRCLLSWGSSVRPGTHGYMDAMKRTDHLNIKSLKSMLLIQGILDRTNLLETSVNLTDPSSWGDSLIVIRDGEPDPHLLGYHVKFSDWVRENNANIQSGNRIIVYYYDYEYANRRNLSQVPRGVPLEVVGDADDIYANLRVLYFGNSEKKRVAFPLSQMGYLNIDHVTLDEINKLFEQRYWRHEYLDSLPCLLEARKALIKQESEEKPFINLLMADPDVKKLGEAHVRKVMLWWKSKVCCFRSVMSDDQKAYRMILGRLKEDYGMSILPVSDNLKKAFGQLPGVLEVIRTSVDEFQVTLADDIPYVTTQTITIGKRILKGDSVDHTVSLVQSFLKPSPRYLPRTKVVYGDIIVESPTWKEIPRNLKENQVLTPKIIEDMKHGLEILLKTEQVKLPSFKVGEKSECFFTKNKFILVDEEKTFAIGVENSRLFLLRNEGLAKFQDDWIAKAHVERKTCGFSSSHDLAESHPLIMKKRPIIWSKEARDDGSFTYTFKLHNYSDTVRLTESVLKDKKIPGMTIILGDLSHFDKHLEVLRAINKQSKIIEKNEEVLRNNWKIVVDQEEKAAYSKFLDRGHDPSTWDNIKSKTKFTTFDEYMNIRRRDNLTDDE